MLNQKPRCLNSLESVAHCGTVRGLCGYFVDEFQRATLVGVVNDTIPPEHGGSLPALDLHDYSLWNAGSSLRSGTCSAPVMEHRVGTSGIRFDTFPYTLKIAAHHPGRENALIRRPTLTSCCVSIASRSVMGTSRASPFLEVSTQMVWSATLILPTVRPRSSPLRHPCNAMMTPSEIPAARLVLAEVLRQSWNFALGHPAFALIRFHTRSKLPPTIPAGKTR